MATPKKRQKPFRKQPEGKISHPKSEILSKYPALKVAMDEDEGIRNRKDKCSGDRDASGDLGWGDYSAKS